MPIRCQSSLGGAIGVAAIGSPRGGKHPEGEREVQTCNEVFRQRLVRVPCGEQVHYERSEVPDVRFQIRWRQRGKIDAGKARRKSAKVRRKSAVRFQRATAASNFVFVSCWEYPR